MRLYVHLDASSSSRFEASASATILSSPRGSSGFLMVRAACMPMLLALVGFAVQAQQPRAATPVPYVAAPKPQVTRAPASPLASARPAAAPLRVVFRDGLLAVHAHGANLADVLNAIQRKTGATFEFPNSAAQEPVAVDLGPASPHDVLAQLLNGSRFDYIVLGRPDDPNEISTVMLQEKSGAGGAAQPVASYPAAAYQPPEVQEQDEVPTEIPADDQPPPPATNAVEDQNPKTPEQMLEELKQLQAQQAQQQQQQQQPGVAQAGQQIEPGQPVPPRIQQPVPPGRYEGPGQPQNFPQQQMPPDQNEPH